MCVFCESEQLVLSQSVNRWIKKNRRFVVVVASSERREIGSVCWVLHTWLRASRICHLIIALRFDSLEKKIPIRFCATSTVKKLSHKINVKIFFRSVESPRTKDSHQRNRTVNYAEMVKRTEPIVNGLSLNPIYLFVYFFTEAIIRVEKMDFV